MKVIYQGKEVGLPTRVKKVIDMFGESIRISPKHVIACKCNNEVKGLDYEIKEGDSVELIDVTSKDGMIVYIRGALFVMSMALHDICPEAKLTINYQLSNSMFCELENIEITEELISKLKKRIHEIVESDLQIENVIMTKEEATEFFKKEGIPEEDQRGKLQIDNKEKNEVALYFCNKYYNYFYGVMPLSTGYIDVIDVKKYKNGFIVRYPSRKDPTHLGEFKESKKFLATLQDYELIGNLIGINTVKDLNEKVKEGKSKEVILMSEAIQEKKIAQLADKIAKRKDTLKMILIAGPSSSSKTTFAKRLGMQLRVNGLKPVTIGTDDYFVERENTPRDENGDYDFETIDALDLELFNDHLTRLISGEEVVIPTFDFKNGTKHYYEDKKMHLADDEILVIEGIHCLNNKLTAENKFKIYISDLTVLNIDPYNRISTTDTRLIRRIVRDYNYRGYSALDTLKRWASVNNGENKNIFPFQEEADAMFNSSLVYELAVLGKYAKPLLKAVDNTNPEYSEAKRMLSFLEYFEEIDETPIPANSLLREFIGGSIFDY